MRRRHLWPALALLTGIASSSAQQTAAVRGVVRNSDGVPQMGAVVELVRADTNVVTNAFTDLNGQFTLSHLSPGTYQVRATAALYLPALRSRLHLRAGERSTVNLMLSGLFEQAWPDRITRHADLPDDWRWTLRSSANRPLLRLVGDDADGELGNSRSSQIEGERPRRSAHATVGYAAGGFASSGVLSSLAVQQVAGSDSSTSFLRLSSLQQGNGPSGLDAAAGLERHSAQGLVRKTAARVLSRPGILLGSHAAEMVVVDVEAGERLPIGDMGELESGALLRAYHLGDTTVAASHPFVRLTATPRPGWDLSYSLAGDPDCQGLDDLGAAPTNSFRAGAAGASLRPEKALHQSVALRRRVGRAVASATWTHDAWNTVVLTTLPRSKSNSVVLASSPADGLIDPASGTALLVHDGFSGGGWLLALSFPAGADTTVSLDGGDNVALAAHVGSDTSSASWRGQLIPVHAQFVRTTVQSRVGRTGTQVKASYSWQPGELVTVVAPYTHAGDGAYLSVHFRQPLRTRSVLRDGAVLTLDASNVLGQGYVAVASADAGLLTFAGTPRTLQGGLAFTF